MEILKSDPGVGREQTVSSETIFQGRVFTVERHQVLLPTGLTGERELVFHNGGVCVLAVDDLGGIYFVRQYRKAVDKILLELPAGKLEANEEALAAAKRELREETGIIALKWQKLGRIYPAPGYCSESLHLFWAEELIKKESQPDQGEYLDIIKLSLAEAWQAINSGEISDAKTVTALLWYKNLIG